MSEQPLPAVFVGLDVGKSDHHAVAVTAAGKTVYDKALPNDEARLRAILEELATAHGPVLMVVDQPATIGALAVAVAQAMESVTVAYLPGLAMRRIADLHPGTAKTDARDALIIAEAARTMPHTLRDIRVDEAQIAELAVLAGFDDDLAAQITATSNRLRGMLTQIHPALERVLGPRVGHPAVADLLTRYPTPAKLAAAGRGHVRARLRKHAPRLAETLTEEIFTALGQQTVVVAGTEAAATVMPILAGQLAALTTQRAQVASQVEVLVEAHPLSEVLTSMPGIGVRTAARILTEVVGKDTSPMPGTWPPTPASPRSPVVPGLRSAASTPPPRWEQEAQTGAIPLGFRLVAPRPVAGLLRPETRPGQTPQPGDHRPGPPADRRPVRDAA